MSSYWSNKNGKSIQVIFLSKIFILFSLKIKLKLIFYRLITSNTYEREMFDKASLKLGLDKAVLQSMTPKENNQQLTRKEVEDLLRKGAYGAVMNEDNEGSKFSEEDIDTILQRRTQTIRLEVFFRNYI